MNVRTTAAAVAAAALVLGSAGVAAATGATGTTGARTAPATAGDLRSLSTEVHQLTAQAPASALVGDSTIRLSGADRYETAVEVSRATWDPEYAVVVYLASGEGYADALAAGPSTLDLGPLLLTTKDALPPSTAAEIVRLQPCAVVVVGGTAAVSDAVARQADALADPAKCSGE